MTQDTLTLCQEERFCQEHNILILPNRKKEEVHEDSVSFNFVSVAARTYNGAENGVRSRETCKGFMSLNAVCGLTATTMKAPDVSKTESPVTVERQGERRIVGTFVLVSPSRDIFPYAHSDFA